MIVNVISESQFFKERFGGIHSAFINHIAMLKKKNIKVRVNSYKSADIVHFHSNGPFAFLKLLVSREPVVITTHVVPQTFIGSIKGAKYLMRIIQKYFTFFYNKADLILALNPKTKMDLERIHVTSKIVILSNPVNNHMFNSNKQYRKKGRKKYKIDKDEFVIIGIGKQIPRKGFDDFLLIAKKLPNLTFIWVGGKDIKAISPQTTIQKQLVSGLTSNVILTGVKKYEDMPILYNMADVLLFTSHHEIAAMAIIEAAACGLPLVMRDLTEYKMLYNKGYAKCRTLDGFQREIIRLSTDKAYYNKRKSESTELANRFNEDVITNKMIEYYKSLI